MISYYIEFIKALLPGLFFSSLSIAPLIAGVIGAWVRLKQNRVPEYKNYVTASILCGAVTLAFLWSSLFGDALSSSSTAGLIFAVVPFYALIVLLLSLGIGKLVIRGARKEQEKGAKNATEKRISYTSIYIPSVILLILVAGIIKLSVGGGDTALAENSRSTNALRYLYDRTMLGETDEFGVLLFMSQNPNAPAELLERMAKSEYPQIRVFVASNRNTPEQIRRLLADDENDHVAKAAKAHADKQ